MNTVSLTAHLDFLRVGCHFFVPKCKNHKSFALSRGRIMR